MLLSVLGGNVKRWTWWQKPNGTLEQRTRELLRAVWDLHAAYGDAQPWLWRGQANLQWNLEAGIHTRIINHGLKLEDDIVRSVAMKLVEAARDAQVDVHEGVRLPDLALLALLQHHGAATPLLDVSLDPIVALYMAVVSPSPDDMKKDGVLFAIKRPKMTLDPFDSRKIVAIYDSLPDDEAVFYSAPDVSERLRIQRGHFLIGKHSRANTNVTLPLSLDTGAHKKSWLWKRMQARGTAGRVWPATKDIGVFRIRARLKNDIRKWLEDRSGLTPSFVLPTAWHQPHLDRFATSHGRRATL